MTETQTLMKNEVNLWLDDVRPAPAGYRWVTSVGAAKAVLSLGCVVNMSLDHDLGNGVLTGYDLVKWCAETGCWSKNKPVVHSMNPVGAHNMRQVIDRYGPY